MPIRCAFCGVRCRSAEASLCNGCLSDLPWRQECCSHDAAPLQVIAAPLGYAFPVDAALKLLKFRRRLDYVPAFSELLYRCIAELPDDLDALLPMPLHWQRQATRGFNQAHELSRSVQQKTGLPWVRGVQRRRATSFQSGLDATARLNNMRGAFVARNKLEAGHVLIIDDVITTGESCRQLALALLDAGAEKVSALALART